MPAGPPVVLTTPVGLSAYLRERRNRFSRGTASSGPAE
jgi:hypothetical protein